MPLTKSDISRWQCRVQSRTNTQASWVSPSLLVFTKVEGVRPRRRYVGPWSGPGACAWDADAVQGVASIEMSVLGNIALWDKERKSRSGREHQYSWRRCARTSEADRAIDRKMCKRETTTTWWWVCKRAYTEREKRERERENPYTVDAYD